MPESYKLVSSAPLHVIAPIEWREACFSFPAMRALERHGIEIRIICPESQQNFWQLSGFPPACTYPQKIRTSQLASRIEGAEQILCWEAGIAAEAAAKRKVPIRFGPAEKHLTRWLTQPIAPFSMAGPVEHRVRHYLHLVETFGIETMVQDHFRPLSLPVEREILTLLAPDSDLGRHYEWPLDRWDELTRILQEKEVPCVITTHGPLGQQLALRHPDIPTLSWQAPELETLARFTLVIGADASLPHLAAHVGAIVLPLFGPGEPEWKRPLGRRHRIARCKVECSPCFDSGCRMDLRCQKELDVSTVLRTLASISENS